MRRFKKKIKLLLANDHLGWKGSHLHGVGRYFLSLIPELSEDIHVVPCIMRKKDALDRYFQEKNIQINYFGRTKFDPRTLLDFIRVIKREKINLMHLQGYASTTFGRIAGILCNVPTLIHQRDADPNHPNYMIIPDIILSQGQGRGLAVSQYAKSFLAEKRKIPLDKIEVLINPINIGKVATIIESEADAVKDRIDFHTNDIVIGMTTRFYPVKGIECLIKAAPRILKNHDNVKFVLCGEGPLLDEMKTLAEELNVNERFFFVGFVDRPEVWISMFDIMVSSSYSEGCPNSILEAMALGKAIVSTKAGGPEEFLEDGYSALMPEPGNTEEIANAIIRLLDDPQLKIAIAANARSAVDQYDIKHYLLKLEDIYKNVLYTSNR